MHFRDKRLRAIPTETKEFFSDTSESVNDPIISRLTFHDLLNVCFLISHEFSPLCGHPVQAIALNMKIFLFTSLKLSIPNLWGHVVFGLKDPANHRLIGIIDLSLQESSGSLEALSLTPISRRLSAVLTRRRKSVDKSNFNEPFLSLQPYICNLLVDKHHRRRGYASRLINFCLRRSENENFSLIHLHVQKSDLAALTLYRKLGFSQVHDLGDVIYMQKSIT